MSNTLNPSIQEQMDVIMQSINALQQQMQPEPPLFPDDVATPSPRGGHPRKEIGDSQLDLATFLVTMLWTHDVLQAAWYPDVQSDGMVTPDFSLGEDLDEHIRAGVKSVVDQYKQLHGVIYCHGKNVDKTCDLDIITASFAQRNRAFGSADIINALQLMGMFGDQVARHQFGASAVELLQPDTADGQNNKRKAALDKIKDSIDRFVDAGVLVPLEEKQVPTFKNPLASRHKSADVFQLVQESNDNPLPF